MATLMVCVLLPATGAQAIGFTTTASPATGQGPYSVAIGDLNGDGRLDLVTADINGSTVSVLLKRPSGAGYTLSASLATGGNPHSVAIGDLNGDGHPDLVTANQSDNTVSVLLNDGTGTDYTLSTSPATGRTPRSVAIGDLNGDGHPDLVTANQADNTVSVLLNDGTGTDYTLSTSPATGGLPQSVAIGDLDGDGHPDLATANFDSDTVSVLLNDGTGTGYTLSASPATGKLPIWVAIGDLDGDGRADLVTANQADNTVSVLLKDTSGHGYTLSASPATGSLPQSVAIGDLDGDGRPDLATADYGSDTVSVLLKDAGGPGYSLAASPATGINPDSVAIGDLNGDGRLDLATANIGDYTVSVLSSVPPPVTADDVPSTYRTSAPVPVTLTATDAGGAGLPASGAIKYLIGTSPADPSDPANNPLTYDPADKPTLSAGQRIRYFATDTAGNAEVPKTSAALVVLPHATNLYKTTATTRAGTGTPSFVAIGDLNGDGRPDLATANLYSNTVSVLLKDASGTGYTLSASLATGDGPSSVAIGDLNGDGRPDLATANSRDSTVSVFVKDASGAGYTLSASLAIGGVAGPRSVAIGDLNGDGRPDLAAANIYSDTVSVFLKNASGPGYTLSTSPATGRGPYSLAIADLDGDGRLDLVTANYGSSTVSVLLKDASGPGYTLSGSADTGDGPNALAVGDLNGDGRPDLATANSFDRTVSVLLKDDAGPGYTLSTSPATGATPSSVAIGDLNGDGLADLVTANSADNTVSVLLKDDVGPGYTLAASPATGTSPSSVAIGDLNGDGRPDLATTDYVSNTVTVISGLYDATPPSTTDDVPTTVVGSPPSVTLASTDSGGGDVASIRYLVGATPADPADPANNPLTYDPASKPVLQDGERIRYSAIDTAGNAEVAKTSAAAQVDASVPETAITGQPADATNLTRPSVTFSSPNGAPSFECRVDTATFTACSSPFTPATDLADGPHQIQVRARNRAGTVDQTPATAAFTVDTRAPSAPQVADATPPPSSSTTQSFAFSGEPGSTFTCRLDDGPAQPCTSPYTAGGLREGTHRLMVAQTDRAGNTGPPATIAFTITAAGAEPLAAATRIVLHPVSRHLVFPTDRTTSTCTTLGGQIRSCTIRVTSRLKAGRIPAGALIASGTRRDPGPRVTVPLTLTPNGRIAVKARPRGFPVTVTAIADTPADTRLTASYRTRLQTSSTITFLLSGHTLKTPAPTQRLLRLTGHYLTTARAITCTAYTDDHHTDAAADHRITKRAATTACTILKRSGSKATFTAIGAGHDRPRTTDTTLKGRLLNRRLVITIVR